MKGEARGGPADVVVRVGRTGPAFRGATVRPEEAFEARIVQGHRDAYVLARAPSEAEAVQKVVAILQRKGLTGTMRLVRK